MNDGSIDLKCVEDGNDAVGRRTGEVIDHRSLLGREARCRRVAADGHITDPEVFREGDLSRPSDLEGASIGNMVYWCEHNSVGCHLIELKTSLS